MIGGDGKSADDAQKKRKTANSDWLVARRKQVWHLGEDEGWDESDRVLRYENLCIATHYGSYWDDYEKTHNKYGQVITEPSGRRLAVGLQTLAGVLHRGAREPRRVEQGPAAAVASGRSGSTATTGCRGAPASPSARRGTTASRAPAPPASTTTSSWPSRAPGIYRGWTNDPSQVHAGDHAFIGSDHTGVIYDASDGTTIEGNTSSSGSQWNGGSVVKKTRGWGYWSAGFGIVDFPD